MEEECLNEKDKKRDIINIIFNIIFALILFAIFVITCVIAYKSGYDEHPDEQYHYKAVRYYEDNFFPPNFNDETIKETFSAYGESRLTELDCYYFLVGKYTSLIEIFLDSSIVILRSFNLILLGCILLLCYKLFLNKSYLFVPFLLSTQVWYVFAYVNNDAWAVFLNLIFVYQLFYSKSMFNNLINSEYMKSKVKNTFKLILLGLLFYMMLIAKINYLIASGLVAIIYLIVNNKTIFSKEKLIKIGGILLIGIICFGVRLAIDFSINGLDRIYNMEEIRIAHATDEFTPPYEEGRVFPNFKWAERGKPLEDVAKNPSFYLITAESFVGVYRYLEYTAPEKWYAIIFVVYIIYLLYISISNIYKKYNKKEYSEEEKGRLLPIIIALVGFAITLILSIYRSYTYDWQPQGRYMFGIIPLFSAVMFNQKRNKILDIILIIVTAILIYMYFEFGLMAFVTNKILLLKG